MGKKLYESIKSFIGSVTREATRAKIIIDYREATGAIDASL